MKLELAAIVVIHQAVLIMNANIVRVLVGLVENIFQHVHTVIMDTIIAILMVTMSMGIPIKFQHVHIEEVHSMIINKNNISL